MTTVTTLPVILKMARHPERIPVPRADRLFILMAMAASDTRTHPRHRIHLLRAIFRLMKRVEPSETLSPKLADVWMANVFAVAFKRDPRTTDMQSVHAIRLLFDVEVWVCSQEEHPSRRESLDMEAPFREISESNAQSIVADQDSRVA